MESALTVQRVVVAFDGSPSARVALGRAVDEAAARGVPIHLVAAVDDAAEAVLGELAYETYSRALQQGVDTARAVLPAGRVTRAVLHGAAGTVVPSECRGDDLVVVGRREHAAVAQALSSTSAAVAARAPCPVLVVRASGRTIGPVVVGVDGSPASARAVLLAGDEAARRGGTLTVVMAVPSAVDPFGFVVEAAAETVDAARQVLDEAAAAARAAHPDLVIETVLSDVQPVEALLRNAEHARLVVLGTRGRAGRLRSLLLGSVSRELLRLAPCEVAVVHPGKPVSSTVAPSGSTVGKGHQRRDTAMNTVRTWHVTVHLFDGDDVTDAQATLTTQLGPSVHGHGRARRNPADADVREIGEEVAAARALRDLAGRLLDVASGDIRELQHRDVHLPS